MAIHNGLFILQIPIAITLGSFWLRGIPLPGRKQVLCFRGGVVLARHCWFASRPSHGNTASSSSTHCRGFISISRACVGGVLGTALGARSQSSEHGDCWCSRRLRGAANHRHVGARGRVCIGAARVDPQDRGSPKPLRAVSQYSASQHFHAFHIRGCLWLTGPMLLLNLWWIYRRRIRHCSSPPSPTRLGLALMQTQFRFSVFGEVPMLLTPLLAAHLLSEARPDRAAAIMATCARLFAAAFYPTINNWQTALDTRRCDAGYANIRSTFPVLKALMRRRPGIVLGDLDTGHWVRYHSKCSVIGDVFLLTPQQAAKAFENARLMTLTPAQLLEDEDPGAIRVPASFSSLSRATKRRKERPNLDEIRASRFSSSSANCWPPIRCCHPSSRKSWEVQTPAGQIFARLYEIERTK